MSIRSRSIYAVLGTSSIAFVTFSFLRWHARKRANISADRAERMVEEGPIIDWENDTVRASLFEASLRRAAKWMSFQTSSDAQPMVGQVGGARANNRPVLKLQPDYILKPLRLDHRGFREIAFYEVVRMTSQNASFQSYASFLSGRNQESASLLEIFAMWFALRLHDEDVTMSEQRILHSWRALKREVELLRRLVKFTPTYYGVVGPKILKKSESSSSPPQEVNGPYEIMMDHYLLLQDVTVNFLKPCVIDIKMGTQTYEPDAPAEKRIREFNKYPQQPDYAFRIVGMRIYDPTHKDACENGFRFFAKEFGRSLTTRDEVKYALKTYFGTVSSESRDAMSGERPTSIRLKSISSILGILRSIRRWFDDNKSLSFYASSLLMVFEGDEAESTNPDMVDVKMIDFGRVRRQKGGDAGYIRGLKTLRDILVELMEEETGKVAVL